MQHAGAGASEGLLSIKLQLPQVRYRTGRPCCRAWPDDMLDVLSGQTSGHVNWQCITRHPGLQHGRATNSPSGPRLSVETFTMACTS